MTRKGERDEEKAEAGKKTEPENPWSIRRLLDTGLAALVSTSENGEKTIVSPLSLPKDLIAHAFSSIDRTKNDMVGMFGREFKRFLEATDLSEVLVKTLSQMSVELKAEIRFKRSDSDEKPTIARVHIGGDKK